MGNFAEAFVSGKLLPEATYAFRTSDSSRNMLVHPTQHRWSANSQKHLAVQYSAPRCVTDQGLLYSLTSCMPIHWLYPRLYLTTPTHHFSIPPHLSQPPPLSCQPSRHNPIKTASLQPTT